MGAAYAVRLVLIRSEGLEGAGLFQAAWAIGGLYVTFVLQAMGTDFYPRLVAAAENDREGNAIVNEQAMVSILLASAGVIGTLTLAPWVVALLYSAEFAGSTETLRWVCVGMALRVVTWPLGYILIAKGRQAYFVTADLTWAVANVALTLQCVRWFGLSGAGIAFFLSYVLHLAVVYPMCRRVSGFRWTGTTLYAAAAFVVAVGSVHAGFLLLPTTTALWFGIGMTALTTVVSVAALRRLVTPARMPRRIAWIVSSKAADS